MRKVRVSPRQPLHDSGARIPSYFPTLPLVADGFCQLQIDCEPPCSQVPSPFRPSLRMRLRVLALAAAALLGVAGAHSSATPQADVMRERSQQGLGFYAAEQRVPSHQRLPPTMFEEEAAARPAPLRFATASRRAPAAGSPAEPSAFGMARGLPPPPGGAAAAPVPPRARPYPAGLPAGPPPSMPRFAATTAAAAAAAPGSYLRASHGEDTPAAVHRMPAPLPSMPSFAVVPETSRQRRLRHHRQAAAAAPEFVEERADMYYAGRSEQRERQEEAPMPVAPSMPHLPAPPVAAPI